MVNLTKNATVNNETVKENGMKTFIDELFATVTEKYDGIVTQNEVMKNNQQLTGFTFRTTEDQSIAPNVYVNDFYKAYENGTKSIDQIADEMISIANNNMSPNFGVEVLELMDWDKVKDKVQPFVICKTGNDGMLKSLVHSDTKTDLAITYAIVLDNIDGGMATASIRKDIFKQYGITMTELKKYAFANAMEEMKLQSMSTMLFGSMMGLEDEDDEFVDDHGGMYVLSTKSKTRGAGMVVVPKVLKTVSKKLNAETFYILPSSIHEVLIITAPIDDVNDLKQMVVEVNATAVATEDKLSDSVYFYDGKNLTQVA